jgi:hypothetical protein
MESSTVSSAQITTPSYHDFNFKPPPSAAVHFQSQIVLCTQSTIKAAPNHGPLQFHNPKPAVIQAITNSYQARASSNISWHPKHCRAFLCAPTSLHINAQFCKFIIILAAALPRHRRTTSTSIIFSSLCSISYLQSHTIS